LAEYQLALPPIEQQRITANQVLLAENLRTRLLDATGAGRRLEQSYIDQAVATDNQYQCTVAEAVRQGLLEPPQDGNHGEKHPKASDYRDRGIPFLMAADIIDGKVDLVGCKFLAKQQADALRIGFARAGDVLLTHKGSIGQSAVLPSLAVEYAMLTPQVTYYRTQVSRGMHPEYLAVVFRSSWFQSQLQAFCTGSTRAYIGITAQGKVSIVCPPLPRQEEVIAVASQLQSSRLQVQQREQKLGQLACELVRGTDHQMPIL
jgi:type I restriction enzyme S subunit